MSSLRESLLGGDQGGNLKIAFSLPSGICRGAGGQVETTGVFEGPAVAKLWLTVPPIVVDAKRSIFTDLQIHWNNDEREHTDQGDSLPSVLLVFRNFSGGAFWLYPPGKPAVELRATQHTLEFNENTPHSVYDTEATPSFETTPSCRNGPHRRSIVCHTKCHSAAEEADPHARSLDLTNTIVSTKRDGLTRHGAFLEPPSDMTEAEVEVAIGCSLESTGLRPGSFGNIENGAPRQKQNLTAE